MAIKNKKDRQPAIVPAVFACYCVLRAKVHHRRLITASAANSPYMPHRKRLYATFIYRLPLVAV